MKIQCKCCQRLYVDGDWTEERAPETDSGVYTVCPPCLNDDDFARFTSTSAAENKLAFTAER